MNSRISFNCDFCGKEKTKKKCHFHLNKGNFCSLSCCAKSKAKKEYDDYISSWLKTSSLPLKCNKLSHNIIKWLKKKKGNKCEQCNWDKVNPVTNNVPVAVHHIDGHSTNNRPDNLIILCPNCHSLTKNYGSLNRGNGRKSRRKNNLVEKLVNSSDCKPEIVGSSPT